jgi:cell division protein FtsB
MFGRKRSRPSRSRRMVTVQPYSATARRRGDEFKPETKRWLKLGIIAVVFYLFVSGNMGAWNLLSLWRTESALERSEANLTAEIFALETRQRMLESDTTYIEKIARTEYNLSRPGEIIYITDDLDP